MENQNENQPGSSAVKKWYNKKPFWIIVVILAVVLVAAGVAYEFIKKQKTVKPIVNSSQMEQSVDLSQVTNYQDVLKKYNLSLSGDQQKFLNQNKFLLVDINKTNLTSDSPRYYDEMLAYFDQLGGNYDKNYRTQADTVLVTPDIVLHAYHKFFDIALKDLEAHSLTVQLKQFVQALYENADTQMQKHTGDTSGHYQKILAQITVAKVLLENQAPAKPDYFASPEAEAKYDTLDSSDTFTNAKIILAKYSKKLTPDLASAALSELQNIYEAKETVSSPLFGDYNPNIQADYTQYTPRSHYVESSALRAYFRTMMYFGRNAYNFKSDNGVTDAVLVSSLFNMSDKEGIKPIDPWTKIMSVTGFFSGQNDDLTVTEVSAWINKLLPNGQVNIINADKNVISQLTANVWQLRLPKILSDAIVSPNVLAMDKNDLLRETLGFRIFGQKFTFDSWLYSQLTAGQEKTVPKLPSTPSALFVPTAFGDARAADYTKQFLKNDAGFTDTEVSAFMQKLNEQAKTLAAVPQDQWNSSLGTGWLSLLSTLTQTYDQKYPLYMQSQYFPNKQIQTFLGSYAELKHDTLLYAKQSYAEMGGGGDDEPPLPPIVRGFVEPNIQFWNKLNNLVSLTQKMFNDNDLGQSQMTSRLTDFKKQVQFFSDMAQKELKGENISDDDYEQLRTTQLSYLAQPLDNVDLSDNALKRSELIADVHTDTLKKQVLYEATGRPYLMLTVVGNAGAARLTAGLAFNHYEFTNSLSGNRLTDDDWKKTVYDNPTQSPEKNFWYQPLMVK